MKVAFKADKWKKTREERNKKKASVKEVAVAVEGPAAAAAPQSTPSAALNSVRAVLTAVLPPQTAGYTFDPDRFTEISGSFWKLTTVEQMASVQKSCVKRLWDSSGVSPKESLLPAIGHQYL